MSHIDVCFALIDASEACAREVARRVRGDVLRLDSAQAPASDWLERADAVVFVGTEVDLAVCQRCVEAGKHVLVVAEACRSHSILDALAQYAAASPAFFELGNPIASLPSRELIWEQCQQGKLGETGLVRVHRWGTVAFESPSQENGLSAALLYELDNALRFFSERPQRVFATEYADRRGYAVQLGCSGGPMAMIDFVPQLAGGNAYASFSVIGSSGSAYADDHPNTQILMREQAVALTVPEASHPQLPMVTSFLARVNRIVSQADGIERLADKEQSNRESLTRWSQTLAIADAIAESVRTRKAIEPNGGSLAGTAFSAPSASPR